MKYLYFYILLATFLGPLARSFEPRISYYKQWKRLLIAIVVVAIPFLIWDAVFTSKGYWGFDSRYITGFKILGLPIEEILYFLIIPFACVFIYEVINLYYKKPLHKTGQIVSVVLVVCLPVFGLFNLDKAYTAITLFLLPLLIVYLHFILKVDYMGKFYFSFLFILIPFYIVNGVLTGTGIDGQVVWYNNAENLGIRILTIPVEDHFYGMLQVLGTVAIYEKLGNKS
ncbi:MAG: lycopene cyclase domain-containing protein [Cyclobacteriaceae bacterium]